MFKDLSDVKVKETVNYLPAGVHEVIVQEVKDSNDRQGYTGVPYTEFKVSNNNGIAYLKMSGATDETSENAIRVRKEIFASFLTAAGATNLNQPKIACQQTIGNPINVCLGEREYWTNDKDTGAPQVKTIVEYRFANPSGKNITWMDKYNKKLSPSDSAAYKAANEAFIGSNSVTNVSDDLPF